MRFCQQRCVKKFKTAKFCKCIVWKKLCENSASAVITSHLVGKILCNMWRSWWRCFLKLPKVLRNDVIKQHWDGKWAPELYRTIKHNWFHNIRVEGRARLHDNIYCYHDELLRTVGSAGISRSIVTLTNCWFYYKPQNSSCLIVLE